MKEKNSSGRCSVKAAGGRQSDTIVDASEASPLYTENRNLGWGGRCSLSIYFSMDLALRYSQTVLTRCFEGAPLSQPIGIHGGVQAEAHIAPLIKSWCQILRERWEQALGARTEATGLR